LLPEPFLLIQVVALIGALLLVALNGFFVAAEFGLVKLRQTRVRSLAAQHGVRGRLLAKVHGHLDAYLSACQLGITLASLGLGWIGEPAFADLLTPVFRVLGIESENVIHGVSLFFAFSCIAGDPAVREGFAVGRYAAVRVLLGNVSGDLGAQHQRERGAPSGGPDGGSRR
jgi:hypothetical protein